MDEDDIELEPCPVCGSTEVEIRYVSGIWFAHCAVCRTESGAFGSHEEAFDAWNSRVVDNDELRYLIMEIEDADVDGSCDWAERIRQAVGL